jgi:hypothetical protein
MYWCIHQAKIETRFGCMYHHFTGIFAVHCAGGDDKFCVPHVTFAPSGHKYFANVQINIYPAKKRGVFFQKKNPAHYLYRIF